MDESTGGTQAVPQLPFSSYYGLLSRSPSRQSPLVEEAVASGAPLPGSSQLRTEKNW
jgi:circadian clock protein KaiC